MDWRQFSPKLGTGTRAHEMLLSFARELPTVASSETEDTDLSDAIEATRRRFLRHQPSLQAPTRQALAATLNVLADLARQGWRIRVRGGEVGVRRPDESAAGSREDWRRQLAIQRDSQLREESVQRFIRSMERPRFHGDRRVSILSLFRDGRELAERLSSAEHIERAIAPYVQVVAGDETCAFTGLRLADVWRYFRHTWTTPYRSVPGRSMMILVRDAAAALHPIIGIAALSSAAPKISVRDIDIGWDPEAFAAKADEIPPATLRCWVLQRVDDRIAELYVDDLLEDEVIQARDFTRPSERAIDALRNEAERCRALHRGPKEPEDQKKSRLAESLRPDEWVRQARLPLFRSKRADELASLLEMGQTFAALRGKGGLAALGTLLASAQGRRAVRDVTRTAKGAVMGTALADLSVCGAVPPYNSILGAKLVAMLITSPQVLKAYEERYSGKPSWIASSMAGRALSRDSRLAYISTSSLYGTRPCQYDRISIPWDRISGRPEFGCVRYKYLPGGTTGVGTFQFSSETGRALMEFLRVLRRDRVNYVFGEGTSPRLRLLRDGLDTLGLDANAFLSHRQLRTQYGVALVENPRDYLLGLDSQPRYLLPLDKPDSRTAEVVAWWRERWLRHRIDRSEVLEELRTHTLDLPIRHGARPLLPEADPETGLLFEDSDMERAGR